MLGVPMLAEDRVLGVIVLWRTAIAPFDDRTIALVDTFATQGAIAIQNVQTSRALEIASGHKSEFLASMSHELRTPLNAVIGFSDVLLERMFGELNERQEEYVRDIRDSGRHLLELINEILDLSKVEAGRMELEPAALSLPELLEQGLALVRERAARQRLTVTLEVAPEVGEVWADEIKLKQVVVNLLTNAVKFTPEGGRVYVAARVAGDEVDGDRARHRDRDRRGGPGADLRGLPARRPARLHRGHRARADAVQALRRAARRARVGRERGRVGQHVRLRDSGEGLAVGAVVLIVEDNARNLKLVRDVLGHRRLFDAGGRATARRGSSLRARRGPISS